MQYLHNSPAAGWLWPTQWQEEPELNSVAIATELAQLDAETPEHVETLFYELLDLPGEKLVQLYSERL